MDRQHDIDMQHEIAALHTSNRWATLGIILVIILATAALVAAIDHYFGADGVRIFLVTVGIIVIVALIYLLSIGVSAIYARQAMAHHNNILTGLIQFQRADDAGEIVRSVANNMGGVLRSGATLDNRVLTVASQLARQQTQALLTAEQHSQQPPAADDWYNVPAQFDEVPEGWK